MANKVNYIKGYNSMYQTVDFQTFPKSLKGYNLLNVRCTVTVTFRQIQSKLNRLR